MLTEQNINNKVGEYIGDKISVKNVTTFYQWGKLYKVTSLIEVALIYIERCFAMVVENQNFLELDFNPVIKILSSSELNIDSELEIINAANKWLKHNSKERLLTDNALNHLFIH